MARTPDEQREYEREKKRRQRARDTFGTGDVPDEGHSGDIVPGSVPDDVPVYATARLSFGELAALSPEQRQERYRQFVFETQGELGVQRLEAQLASLPANARVSLQEYQRARKS